LFVFVSLL